MRDLRSITHTVHGSLGHVDTVRRSRLRMSVGFRCRVVTVAEAIELGFGGQRYHLSIC
jgi:hypothetical protein